MDSLKVLVLSGQIKHSRVDNDQADVVATELAKGGVLYRREIFFNFLINLPSFILSIVPVWLLIKHLDDFKDIDDCDIIVVSGKKMIRFARHLRHYMFPSAKIVQIGNPVCKIRKNDILIRQKTSRFIFDCNNTIKINGLLSKKLNKQLCDEYSEKFNEIKKVLNSEFIGVFINGDKYRYKLSVNSAAKFAKVISRIAHNMQMSLLVLVDGKVDSKSIEALKQNLDCSYYFFEKQKDVESPKVAFMSWAKYFILNGNVINDQSEYIAQMKPTYIYITSDNRKRYCKFVDAVIENGSARILQDDCEILEDFVPNELNDLQQISEQVKNML